MDRAENMQTESPAGVKTSPLKKGVSWHYVASEGEVPLLILEGVWSTPSLPLLPDLLWPGVVVLIRVLSSDQFDRTMCK